MKARGTEKCLLIYVTKFSKWITVYAVEDIVKKNKKNTDITKNYKAEQVIDSYDRPRHKWIYNTERKIGSKISFYS